MRRRGLCRGSRDGVRRGGEAATPGGAPRRPAPRTERVRGGRAFRGRDRPALRRAHLESWKRSRTWRSTPRPRVCPSPSPFATGVSTSRSETTVSAAPILRGERAWLAWPIGSSRSGAASASSARPEPARRSSPRSRLREHVYGVAIGGPTRRHGPPDQTHASPRSVPRTAFRWSVPSPSRVKVKLRG